MSEFTMKKNDINFDNKLISCQYMYKVKTDVKQKSSEKMKKDLNNCAIIQKLILRLESTAIFI